jgi:hypothetical protein
MAWTERYVTTSGTSGHTGTNDTSDAWDFITGWQAVGTGIRLNIKAGNYSINNGGASINTLSTQTSAAPAWIRGYTTTIGDLVCSRDSNGDLVTSGMPIITLSAQDRLQLLGNGNILEGIKVIGSRSNEMILFNSNYGYMYNVSAENQYNLGFSASSALSSFGWGVQFISCDAKKTGTDTASAINCTVNNSVIACKIQGGAGVGVQCDQSCSVIDTVIRDAVIGIQWGAFSNAHVQLIANCTFYNCSTAAIQFPNNANAAAYCTPIVNCHATDCGQFIKNLYTTAVCANAPIRNRTRDNTSANNNNGDWPLQNSLTTDNGNYTSDYVDALTNKNYRLKPTAVGRAAGLVPYRDIGATQAPSSSNSVF